MTLTPVQAAHRAAHRARLEVESQRAANSHSDVAWLLAWRDECRETMRSKHSAMLVLEDEVFTQLTQIAHVQRRLCQLGYTGD